MGKRTFVEVEDLKTHHFSHKGGEASLQLRWSGFLEEVKKLIGSCTRQPTTVKFEVELPRDLRTQVIHYVSDSGCTVDFPVQLAWAVFRWVGDEWTLSGFHILRQHWATKDGEVPTSPEAHL